MSFQEKNFKLAEQLFHAALKIAQTQLQNENEITNMYNKLADVAFESGDYKAARKLLTSIMERLFSVGVDQNDLRILNLSLKLAKTFERLRKFGYVSD
jgi:tetratricopeptide repeat protein 19